MLAVMVELSTLARNIPIQQVIDKQVIQESSMSPGNERFLCMASYKKGHDFMRQLADLGVKPTLLTLDKHKDGPWPRDILEELVTMPANLTNEQITTP